MGLQRICANARELWSIREGQRYVCWARRRLSVADVGAIAVIDCPAADVSLLAHYVLTSRSPIVTQAIVVVVSA